MLLRNSYWPMLWFCHCLVRHDHRGTSALLSQRAETVTALIMADLALGAVAIVLMCGVLVSALVDWWRLRGLP